MGDVVYSGGVSDPAGLPNSDGDTVQTVSLGLLDNLVFVDAFGNLQVDSQRSDISLNVAYGLFDTDFDFQAASTTGDGATDVSNGYLEVSSAVTGTSSVSTRDFIRYSNGRGFFITFTASFTAAGGGSGVGKAGGFDSNDGFLLRYTESTGKLEFGYLESGTFTGATEIDTTELDIDPEKLNIFCILGGFLGVANPTLFVRKDGWKVAAVIRTEGVLNEAHTRLPAFPITLSAENGMTVTGASFHGGTYGGAEKVQDRGFSYPNQIFGAGNTVAAPRGRVPLTGTNTAVLFIMRVKSTFNSLPNKVKADIITTNFHVEPSANSGTVQIQLVGNPTLSGASYSDVSTDQSVLEIDDNANAAATGTYSSGGRLIGEPINLNYSGSGGGNGLAIGGESQSVIDQLSLDGVAGDVVAVLARDLQGNGVALHWHITWIERQI